jgi:hypothetical protein
MRVVKKQGTEQARAHRVHLGLLHPVIQLQTREAAAGGLDESLVMLQPRMPENHQSAGGSVPLTPDHCGGKVIRLNPRLPEN